MTEEPQKAPEAPSACWLCTEAQTHCYHDLGDLELAAALAKYFQGDDPDAQQISWFLDDANAISKHVGSGPWTVTRMEPVNCDQAIAVNGLVCILREGGKDCPAYLEAVCRLSEDQGASA